MTGGATIIKAAFAKLNGIEGVVLGKALPAFLD
jgi:hypothetical protein